VTRAFNQWPELYQLFMALHPDYDEDFDSPDAALDDQLAGTPTADLHQALVEWHQAFDSVTDAEVVDKVNAFNSWWDAEKLFGGHRQWAEWVREHLERELARRTAGSTAG
jgi:hypothetical protein